MMVMMIEMQDNGELHMPLEQRSQTEIKSRAHTAFPLHMIDCKGHNGIFN